MKSLSLIFLLVVVCSFGVNAQDSFQKEDLLNARKSEQERKKNLELCAKMIAQESISDNRCFGVYPTSLIDFGKGFSEGLAKITVDGKAGFINPKGEIVIQPKLKEAGRFSENLAPFETDDGKWGFIDKTGQIAIEPKFDWAISFHEGLALVQIGELWGYIDRTGKIVIEPKFKEAASFSEGLARVAVFDKNYVWENTNIPNGKNTWGFIDKLGNWVLEPTFDYAFKDFNGGMALVSRNVNYDKGIASENFFIDTKGRELWILDSRLITRFSEDVMVVAVGKNKNDSLSFIDRNGKQLFDKTFAQISEFSEGLSAAKVSLGSKYGYIDKKGDFVIKPKFAAARPFSEGLAGAELESGGFGYIDKSGKWVIKPQFYWVWEFREGLALVAPNGDRDSREKTGYIDRNGNYIWKPTK